MSATREMMKVVVAAFAPTLKLAGYRKNGAQFRQNVSQTAVRLVNIQSSPWNAGNEGSFTVNLGVYHRDVAALHDAMRIGVSPGVRDCIIQQPIGFLMPIGRDFWWPINPQTDLSALGEEVAAVWINHGKPWLEATSTLEGAREHLLKHRHYFLAAMASLAMGKPDDAHLCLDKALEDWPEGKNRIEAWRSNHLTPRKRKTKNPKH